MDGEEIVETENFEVKGFTLVWNSNFKDSYGGGYDRVFYNNDDSTYLIYTNKNGYEGFWSCLSDVVEFVACDDFDNVFKKIDDAINGQD